MTRMAELSEDKCWANFTWEKGTVWASRQGFKYQSNEFGLYPEVNRELLKDFKQIIRGYLSLNRD